MLKTLPGSVSPAHHAFRPPGVGRADGEPLESAASSHKRGNRSTPVAPISPLIATAQRDELAGELPKILPGRISAVLALHLAQAEEGHKW